MIKCFSPLGLRISLAIILSVAVLGVAASFYLTARLHRDTEAQFLEGGRSLSLLLAKLVSEGIAEENLDLVKRASYILDTPGVEYINVYSEYWDLIETYPPKTKHPHGLDGVRAHFLANPESRFFVEEYPERGIYDFYARVDYRPFVDSPPVAAGFVEIDFKADSLLEARARSRRLHLQVALVLCATTILVLLTSLHLLVVRPVRRLKEAVEGFERGESPPDHPWRGDEIGDLAGRFKEMAETIEERNRALAEQRRYLDTLLTSSSYGIAATDTDLKIRYFNPRAELLFRCRANEVIGKNVREIHLLRGVDEARMGKALARVREHGSHTLRHEIDNNGETLSLESSVFVIRDEKGSPAGFLLITQDISQRLKFQRELERSNQELTQFAYVASHDLQEPLRVIAGFVQLLEQRCAPTLDDESREYMAFIVDATNRMKTLINDLLTYSRLTTKAKPLEMVDLNETLSVAQKNLQSLISERGAEIVCERPLPVVRGERVQMGQLLQNLLANAINYQRPGTIPQVRLEARLQGREWLLRVTDNGIGIETRFFERIFKIFQRLHNKEEYPGTGIGLAICKKIVERHGGRIWVESEPGAGSTFCFTLLALAERSQAPPSEDGERRQRASDRRRGWDDRRQGVENRRHSNRDRRGHRSEGRE